jgi:hypothetical protein
MKKFLLLMTLQLFGLSLSASAQVDFEVYTPSSLVEDSKSPELGQLQPVNQINLREGYHLLDLDLNYSQWSADLPPDQSFNLARVESVRSQETAFTFRYAYGLFRFTYLGLNLGVLQKSEGDFFLTQGYNDPDFFIGQHFPWENGDFRLTLYASPSLGVKSQTMNLSDEGQTFKSNALRGGFRIKPTAALSARVGPIILGSEASYTYFGKRVVETENPEGVHDNFYNQTNNGYFTNNSYNSNNNSNTNQITPNYYAVPQTLYRQDITNGNIIGFKANLEVPRWQRLGLEYSIEQFQSRHYELENGYKFDTDSYNQSRVKTYARFKITNQMSIIPEINWIQAPPNGTTLTANNDDIWLFGILYRAKFN